MKRFLLICGILFSTIIYGSDNKVDNIRKAHEQFVYPVVRITYRNVGGSGTIIRSAKEDQDNYCNYVLTNHHVVEEAITQEKEFSTLTKQFEDTEKLAQVNVEVFRYMNISSLLDRGLYTADILTYEKSKDIAIVMFRTPEQYKYVATLPKKGETYYMTDNVCYVGAALGHKPIMTKGQITSISERIDNELYFMANCASIYGNCLAEGTMIRTEFGEEKIENLKAGNKIYSVDKKGIILTNVDEIIDNGYRDVFEIRTSNRKVKATNNHKFLILSISPTKRDINGKIYRTEKTLQWKELKDIKKGDIITILKNMPDFNNSISKEEALLIGFYLGDGYSRRRKGEGAEIQLYTYNDNLQKKYYDIISRYLPYEKISTKNNTLALYSVSAYEQLNKIGLCGDKALNKRLPKFVFGLNHESKQNIIEGYLDSDGYINPYGYMVFEANNEMLIHDFRNICIDVGFRVSNISERMRKDCFVNGRLCSPNAKSYSFQAYQNTIKNGPSYKALKESYDNLPEGLSFDRVSKISYCGKERTYDIKVSNSHSFFAENILVHNSGGAAFLEDGALLIGVPSRIDITRGGFTQQAIPHLNYFIPIDEIYKTLDKNGYGYIWDATQNWKDCAEKRKNIQEGAKQKKIEDSNRKPKEIAPPKQTVPSLQE